MAPIKAGDYITFVINDPPLSTYDADKPHETKYGQVISITSTLLKYHPSDDIDSEATADIAKMDKKLAGIKVSGWAKIRMQSGPNFREAAENVAFFAAYQGFIRKKQVMGAEVVSFGLSELAYELMLKSIVSGMMPGLLGPTKLTKDADSYFQMSDFTEPSRRIVPIWALQQVIQKYMYRKPWGADAIPNLIGGYGAMALSNIADRMYFQEDGKYKYP